MKKLLQILAVPLAALAFAAIGTTTVSAQQSPVNCAGGIVISNTGQGSTNSVICAEQTDITVVCTNNTTLTITTDQDAESGVATIGGNTNAGGAATGNATNSNDAEAIIANVCGVDQTTEEPAVEEEEEAPKEPEVKAVVTTLPDTGSANPLQIIAAIAGGVMALLVAARFASTLYVRNQN